MEVGALSPCASPTVRLGGVTLGSCPPGCTELGLVRLGTSRAAGRGHSTARPLSPLPRAAAAELLGAERGHLGALINFSLPSVHLHCDVLMQRPQLTAQEQGTCQTLKYLFYLAHISMNSI